MLVLMMWIAFTAPSDTDALQKTLEGLVLGQKATYGIAYHNLSTGEELLINADDLMHAASTMKVPVMMRLFQMFEERELQPDQELKVVNRFKSIVDGSEYSITEDWDKELYGYEGDAVPIREMIRLMIVRSSNLATNILIELADAKKTTALMHALGARDIQVLRGVEDIKAYQKGLNNQATASDLMNVMISVADSTRFSQNSRREMMSILQGQEDLSMIPGGLPKGKGIVVANKTGAISRVQHDAAIVILADGTRYVLVVFSRDFKDQRDLVLETARKISGAVYSHVTASTP